MKFFIPLKLHNIIDYIAGAFLFACPYFFNFDYLVPARNVFSYSGTALITYSLLTNYRYSFFRIIPLGIHMAVDIIIGLTMISAPWLFNYFTDLTQPQFILHMTTGVAVLLLVAFTYPKSEAARTSEDFRTTLKEAA